ncbi:LPP20 family lipoprotein [Vibrio sp. N418]|uniref:LPP20 family lipoprotein n=1 Tax=Vibrio sp. (strain N418) TaxID=701176 RepID=UPI000571A977|nr:LPP20 family lipoprotein [Vibrio sp. N418]
MNKTLVAASLTLLLSACSNIQTVEQSQDFAACTFPDSPSENAPGWVCDITPTDLAISATGYAKKSAAGMGIMKKVALANAQVILAAQLKAQVSNKFSQLMDSSVTSGVEDAALESVYEKIEDITENVVSQSLSGARIQMSMVSPKGGLYLLIGMDQATYNANISKAVDELNNDSKLWDTFNSEQAAKELQQALESMKQQ